MIVQSTWEYLDEQSRAFFFRSLLLEPFALHLPTTNYIGKAWKLILKLSVCIIIHCTYKYTILPHNEVLTTNLTDLIAAIVSEPIGNLR